MGMGKRKRSKQDSLFIPTASLARSSSHDFYERLNQVLSAAGIDDFVEDLCEPFYVHLTESTPDHSTLSRIRQRLPVEVHDEVGRRRSPMTTGSTRMTRTPRSRR